jgi:hypothetical protein
MSMPDPDLRRYVEVLYGRATGDDAGFVGVVTHVPNAPPDKPSWWNPKRWHRTDDPDLAALLAEDMATRTHQVRHHHGCHPGLFTNFHPFASAPEHGRGGRWDVRCVSTLAQDLDWFDPERHKGLDLPSPSERQALCTLGPTPTAITFSGAGVHPLWALDQAYPVEVAQPMMSAFLAVLEATAAPLGQSFDGEVTIDLARVLRLPSSFNTKVPNRSIPVRLGEVSGVIYEPHELIGREAWERCQRPAERHVPSHQRRSGSTRATTTGDEAWDWIAPDPLAARVTGEVMVELLVEEGWHLDRQTEREGDPYWSLTRPGKAAGCSASVRQYADHAVLYVFSEAVEAAPFRPGRGYGARSFLEALYGQQWPAELHRLFARGDST